MLIGDPVSTAGNHRCMLLDGEGRPAALAASLQPGPAVRGRLKDTVDLDSVRRGLAGEPLPPAGVGQDSVTGSQKQRASPKSANSARSRVGPVRRERPLTMTRVAPCSRASRSRSASTAR